MPRKSVRSFRTTISIPIDLKERMDKYHGQVNWSAVASLAFEKVLEELTLGLFVPISLESLNERVTELEKIMIKGKKV